MRSVLAISFLLLLAGCGRPDQLHSEYPLLSEAKDAQPLREGLWLWPDDSCPVDFRRPAGEWPDCAHWALVEGRQISERQGPDDGDRHEWRPFVFASGEPGLLQVRDGGDFVFEFAQPLSVDAGGYVVEIRRWPILCGEEDIEDDEEAPQPSIPGAYRVGETCYAPDTQTLAAAARQTPEDHRFPVNFRWVREGRS